MILPTKHLTPERSLLGIATKILKMLLQPRTISYLWESFNDKCSQEKFAPVTYEWFILGIDLLFMLGIVSYKNGQLVRHFSKNFKDDTF